MGSIRPLLHVIPRGPPTSGCFNEFGSGRGDEGTPAQDRPSQNQRRSHHFSNATLPQGHRRPGWAILTRGSGSL